MGPAMAEFDELVRRARSAGRKAGGDQAGTSGAVKVILDTNVVMSGS